MPIRCSIATPGIMVLASVLVTATSFAQEAPSSQSPSHGARELDEGPWTRGVPDDRRKRATLLYEEGNQFLADALFADAVSRYRDALQSWNHPAIHYNLMVALRNLGENVEAYKSSVEALRYRDAIEPEEYQRALQYQRDLRQYVAEIEVICTEPEATVTLDGKPLFTGPRKVKQIVAAGTYLVEARKRGYMSDSKTVTVATGKTTTIELQVWPVSPQARFSIPMTRRWPAWLPWTVAGAGVALGVGGTLLERQASQSFRRFDAMVTERCPDGCREYPGSIAAFETSGEGQRLWGSLALAGGIGLVATSVVLLYCNRPRARRERVDGAGTALSILPIVAPDHQGIAATLFF